MGEGIPISEQGVICIFCLIVFVSIIWCMLKNQGIKSDSIDVSQNRTSLNTQEINQVTY